MKKILAEIDWLKWLSYTVAAAAFVTAALFAVTSDETTRRLLVVLAVSAGLLFFGRLARWVANEGSEW